MQDSSLAAAELISLWRQRMQILLSLAYAIMTVMILCDALEWRQAVEAVDPLDADVRAAVTPDDFFVRHGKKQRTQDGPLRNAEHCENMRW